MRERGRAEKPRANELGAGADRAAEIPAGLRDTHYTTEEAAEKLDGTIDFVHSLRSQRKISGRMVPWKWGRFRKKLFVNKKSLEAFMEKRRLAEEGGSGAGQKLGTLSEALDDFMRHRDIRKLEVDAEGIPFKIMELAEPRYLRERAGLRNEKAENPAAKAKYAEMHVKISALQELMARKKNKPREYL
ncbi:MAG: hypothetical protein NTY90_04840 [Candidatus Micrarchaeota archaeon]|nr:hypothetical protein [Candidatus Micrarchaeota archaeon]